MKEVLTCLEQKVILLTKILNLTKQIEVRSKEREIELDNFLDQRGAYIVRVNKCDDLILSLSESLPLEQQKRLQQILRTKLVEEECSKEELPLLKLSLECSELLHRAAVLDQSARDAIQQQCNELREKLNETRKSGNQQTMYNNIR